MGSAKGHRRGAYDISTYNKLYTDYVTENKDDSNHRALQSKRYPLTMHFTVEYGTHVGAYGHIHIQQTLYGISMSCTAPQAPMSEKINQQSIN